MKPASGFKSIDKEGIMANFDGMINIMLGFLKKSDSNFRDTYRVQCSVSWFLSWNCCKRYGLSQLIRMQSFFWDQWMGILILLIDGPRWYLYTVCSFALCENDIVDSKVVLIFMLCQIFDFLRLLWEKRRKALFLICRIIIAGKR